MLPLVSAVIVLVIGSDQPQWVRRIALVSSLLTLLLVLRVVSGFDNAGDEYLKQYVVASAPGEDQPVAPFDAAKTAYAASEFVWLPPSTGFDIRFSTGLDGLSVWMYGLSAILMVSAVLVSWTAVTERVALFYCMLLLLEAGCLGVFAARDIIVFYVFFEFTLIPLFFLIGIWGSEQRRYAAIKFFLYTLFGSLFTFLGLLTLVLWHSDPSVHVISGSIPELLVRYAANPLPTNVQFWVFLALFAGFAIKVPLFPLHTWLPLAHVQAPTAGSVFLAGILLKIGTYGFLRFNMPLLPDATVTFLPWIMWLSVVGIIYGAIVALVQSDMKRLIAYSSVSHLGFCMLGLFALNPIGLQGGALQMVNHGISTGALFALIGMLYERYHTREIAKFGGLTRRFPVMAFFMVLFTFSSIGLPGLNGFAGEIMILAGTFQRAWAESTGSLAWHLRWVSVLAVSGVVLGAWYMLI
ncbi:MAG: NADH-quinone oxidoreductase subunit M, partial [Planctomycetales bacterium]|nr:NADH-quinone oxidoreductase subunit M [Planctomycetales bacterium]